MTQSLAQIARTILVMGIDVDPSGDSTTVSVRRGEGEAYGEGAAYVISAQQSYRFTGTGLADYDFNPLPPPDAFDRWALSQEGKKYLVEDAETLKQHPEAKLVIEGYCDERGSREYNLVLGDKRAQEAMHYLASLGIKNPVKVISYGKERQVCAEHDESCYWKNRRAHMVVEKGK